jgi:predicted cupin superfamily sugar epimerase
MTPQEIIRFLDLKRHPEGGFYRETYRSFDAIPGTARVYSTAIYYLLVSGAVSKMHRLKYDEVFHFYMGDPVTWVLLEASKKMRKIVLGNKMQERQHPQMLVKAGTWFGGALNKGGSYALMGTTVAPGFEFEDFVLGKSEELLRDFPDAEKEISELT